MLALTLASGETRTIASGMVELPRTGIWLADLKLLDQDVPSGRVVATMGGVAMPATVAVAELVNGIIDLRIVGGAGGLGNTARAKHYHRPLARHVLDDLMRDAGEILSPTCTPDTVSTPLEAWTTLALPTGAILAALCAVLACNWRVLPDGTVWIGVETWPDSAAVFRSIETDGANATKILGTDEPAVWPGTLLGGRRVDSVTYDVGRNRTHVLFAEVA